VSDSDVLTGNQHADHVEPVRGRVGSEAVHPDPRRPAKFPLLAEPYRPHGTAERVPAAGLDLHEGHFLAPPDHEVDVAMSAAKAMRNDAPPLTLHPARGDALAQKSQCLSMIRHGASIARADAPPITESSR
jgi:hypothetical protein